MNNAHKFKYRRLRASLDGQQPDAGSIPQWAELSKLGADEVRALAAANGVPYTGFMQTKSALNRAR